MGAGAWLAGRGAGYKYILGARIKKEPADVVEWMLAQEKISDMYHEHTRKNGERLIVGYSEQRAKKDAHNREKGIERLRKAFGRFSRKRRLVKPLFGREMAEMSQKNLEVKRKMPIFAPTNPARFP